MKIIFLLQGDGPARFFRRACQELEGRYRDRLTIEIVDTAELDAAEPPESYLDYFGNPDFFYLDIHGGLPYFKRFEPFWREVLGTTPAFVRSDIEDENALMRRSGSIPAHLYDQIMRYLDAGGAENSRSILLLLLREYGGCPEAEVPGVRIPRWHGLYGRPVRPGKKSDGSAAERACTGAGSGGSAAERTCAGAGTSGQAAETEHACAGNRVLSQAEEESCLERIREEKRNRIVVGILIHYHYILQKDTAHIDALMDAVRACGAVPLAVYTNMMPSDNGFGGLKDTIRRYLIRDGEPLADVLIVTTGHSLTALSAPGDGREYSHESVFGELDVPVLQAMTTFYTMEQWEASQAGMDPMLLCSNIYQPEFDGQIISVPVACTEQVMTEYGSHDRLVPIPERVRKAARLAVNWGRLRRIPQERKRVAIVLHNMPPRADMIGCAYGLDTPESVFGICRLLKEKGISLAYEFESGQQIIQQIIEGTTNDGRFLSEQEMLARCKAVVEKEQYREWFDGIPRKNRQELQRDWGEPPGTFMAVDEQVLVPGILNGNLFIGLQPPRAFEEKAEEAYHSTDLVCPHQYLAFYRYLEKIFRADVIVHMGTHGTLEWLPGKEIGLSRECWPDLTIGDLPHIYPYIIDVPGEGMQAKRRSAAAILDHCIPSVTESGSYGAAAELEERIEAYYHAKTADPGKLGLLEQEIWEQAEASDFCTDLKMTRQEYRKDPQKAIERLHLWLSEIRSSKIKDGLHVFGKAPQGERFWNLVRQLVSVPNGAVPSLREALAEEAGEDLEELLAHPEVCRAGGRPNALRLEELDEAGQQGRPNAMRLEEPDGAGQQGRPNALRPEEPDEAGQQGRPNALRLEEPDEAGQQGRPNALRPEEPDEAGQQGRPNALRLEELDEAGRRQIAALAEAFAKGDEAAERYVESPAVRGKLRECLRFVLHEAVPRLLRVTEELEYFGRAVDGRFVPPGPSGAPTRGNAGLLPTGRNFYAIDPTAVPTHSAWKTGKLLGDQLLANCLAQEGRYPEHVAIVVYSGETMKTGGDDIAEILYLYGVRPVWLGALDRVIGLEVIPAEELGRPRIDVTLRITGLFRDTFPNLIERIEDAVNLVASLEETDEENYVRRHVTADLNEFLQDGMQLEQARGQAQLRVFGCPPGNYGAGVEILINSRKWSTQEDLGRMYLNWSSHAYSRKLHGEKTEELLARQLKRCEVTVKNISSFETDMLDDEDYYNYHGGLISAVRMLSGKAPASYSTDASDPLYVRTRDIRTETARIMRARICNPRWQEGMKRHGYRGAQEFSAMVDILFGWDATGGVAEDWMYEAVARDYLMNEEVREWMREVNPFALHAISERLLEASQRGMWEAEEDTLAALQEIYLSADGDLEDL